MDNFSGLHPQINCLADVDPYSDSVTAFREREEQRLADLYAPLGLRTTSKPDIVQSSSASSDPIVQLLLDLWNNQQDTVLQGASMQEEHEREVAHEVEQETQIERPSKATPITPSVDPLLHDFICKGRVEKLMRFASAYDSVLPTTSRKFLAASRLWTHVRVTKDFVRAVQQPLSGYCDSYLRPANWVLTSRQEMQPTFLLLISQHEANTFLRAIQSPSSGVQLHTYEPRVTKSMASVDHATSAALLPSVEEWQSLSSSLRRELNIFAGQVYFNTYKDYKALCKELGPRFSANVDETLGFVRGWIAIRRKGQDFTRTHLGWVVDGRAIGEDEFER